MSMSQAENSRLRRKPKIRFNPSSSNAGTRALSRDVRERIIELIHDQLLAPDDQLPSEDDLSRTLQVSRATLREALVMLEGQGIVERRHGIGTFVSVIRNSDFDDLVEYRHMIESYCGTAIIQRRITDVELAEWISVLDQTKAPVTLRAYTKLQFEFHAHMVHLAGNRFIESQYRELMDRLEMIYFFGSGAKEPETIYSEHLSIIKAVEESNLSRFLSEIYFHIFSASGIIKSRGFGKTGSGIVNAIRRTRASTGESLGSESSS